MWDDRHDVDHKSTCRVKYFRRRFVPFPSVSSTLVLLRPMSLLYCMCHLVRAETLQRPRMMPMPSSPRVFKVFPFIGPGGTGLDFRFSPERTSRKHSLLLRDASTD